MDDQVSHLVFVVIDLLIVGYLIWQRLAPASKTLHLRKYVVPESAAEIPQVRIVASAIRAWAGVLGSFEPSSWRVIDSTEVELREWVRRPRRWVLVAEGFTFQSVNRARRTPKDSAAEPQEPEKPTDQAHASRPALRRGLRAPVVMHLVDLLDPEPVRVSGFETEAPSQIEEPGPRFIVPSFVHDDGGEHASPGPVLVG